MVKRIQRIVLFSLAIAVSLYVILCTAFYFFQERFIFYPEKLSANHQFMFYGEFDEINTLISDSTSINGLLFKVQSPKGLIFFLHGNAGSLDSWGSIAGLYNDLGYDFYILDYPGFGKSEGSIDTQQQLYSDIQSCYDEMKEQYTEGDIIIMGYSIGTGLATYLASTNKPRMLVLHAPYYSLESLIKNYCPILPSFLIRYKLETYKYISECKMPIIIFHGMSDELIGYANSGELWAKMDKTRDQLILLENQEHNGIMNNIDYQKDINLILNNYPD